MSISLGNTLKGLRKEQKVSQGQLSRGLCSVANLSKIELGEREPGQMLFEALISRLGKDSKKWELILTEEDKQLFEKTNCIEYFVETKQWGELEQELEQDIEVRGVSQKLYEQYRCLLYGILYKERKDYKMALRECIKGLEKTGFYIEENRVKIQAVVSKNELRILYLIGKILLEGSQEICWYFDEVTKISDTEEGIDAFGYWNSLFHYVNERCTDPRYRLEFYLEALYYLAFIAYEEERYEDCISYCENGLQELVQKKSTHYLKDFLLLLQQLRKKKDIQSLSSLVPLDSLELFLKTIEERENIYKQIEDIKQYIRSYNGMYSINEIIKNTRAYYGKTQQEVMETKDGQSIMGNQSGISKIENGKRTPRRSSGQYYLKNLGLSGKEDYYQLAIRGEDFEIQELRWEIDFYMANHKMEKAKELYEILEQKIDMSNPYNEQYMKTSELIIRSEMSSLSCEQFIQELYSILSITVKDIDRLEEKEGEKVCFFTREEIVIIMNIGCAYHEKHDYENALKYYQKVDRYFRDFYQSSGSGIYRTISYNISQIYGLLGHYDQSMEKSKAYLFMEMLHRYANTWCRIVFNIGWCYGKMMLNEQDVQKREQYKMYCDKFFKQSHCIAQFYNDETVIHTIKMKRELWDIEE